MAHMVQRLTSRRNEVLNLSFCGFAFWWLIIVGVHLITCLYNLAYAKLYWEFEETMFNFIFLYHEIGISSRNNLTIVFVFMTLASVHGVCALSMIVGSLWQRTLVFSLRKKMSPSSSKSVNGTSSTNPGFCHYETEVSTRSAKVVRFLSAAYHRVASQHGFLGVKGRYFHVILICREIVEVALQTNQAIRMSKYLPRLLLNRFYVSLLAINCCSSVFVYSHWFSPNEARRRFAAVLCDCILNLMTTIGVSLIIMLSYVHEYDIDSFRWEHLKDDEWVAQTLNEARVVLVGSWSDLVARAIFPLSLVATTTDMKALLSHSHRRKKQVARVNSAGPSVNLTGLVPEQATTSSRNPGIVTTSRESIQSVERFASYNSTGLQSRKSRFILQWIHALFAVWGVVVLALHLHASSQNSRDECAPKVLPMAGALPSCYAVQFNCYKLRITATKDELEAEWNKFDRTTAVKLRILHCKSIEMPKSFQDFSALQEIVIYNSTILDWDDTAALTNTHHPKLRYTAVVRTNMTEGFLPLGFQSRNFPALMLQISFCETNLAILPNDLRWPKETDIFIENSMLATVPSAIAQMQPFSLALTGNPLTDLPAELFQAGIEFLFIGDSGMNELPQNVTPSVLSTLDITNTNISSFPMWIDALINITSETPLLIAAGGSPYCSDLENIISGRSASFRNSFHPEHSSVLMNASEANWELLQLVVTCSPPLWSTQYAIDIDDEVYALGHGDGTGM